MLRMRNSSSFAHVFVADEVSALLPEVSLDPSRVIKVGLELGDKTDFPSSYRLIFRL
jgi:hypothetical protein